MIPAFQYGVYDIEWWLYSVRIHVWNGYIQTLLFGAEIYFVYVISILVFRKPYKTMHYRFLLRLVTFSKAEQEVGGSFLVGREYG